MEAIKAAMRKRRVWAVLFIIGLLKSSRLRRGIIKALIATDVGAHFSLQFMRLFLGWFFPPILRHWWFPWPGHIAQDGCQVLHGVKYETRIRYGAHPREELDVLHPYDHPKEPELDPLPHDSFLELSLGITTELFQWAASGGRIPAPRKVYEDAGLDEEAPAVIFGHGGGWVCQGTDVQLQQLTPLARAGYAIYTFNYPLAPEDRFPTALVSTLKTLIWAKRERGHEDVALLGESAGGNLVTMAGALVSNPHLLEDLCRELPDLGFDKEVVEMIRDLSNYPRIRAVVSWYSILDSRSWRGAKWLSVGLEKVMDMYISGSFRNRVTLHDLEADLHQYPPTLLIAGELDPLGLTESSKIAHEMLTSKGHAAHLEVYPNSTHGFIGYPYQMQVATVGKERANHATAATNQTIHFLRKHHPHPKGHKPYSL